MYSAKSYYENTLIHLVRACETRSQCVSFALPKAPLKLSLSNSIVFHMLLSFVIFAHFVTMQRIFFGFFIAMANYIVKILGKNKDQVRTPIISKRFCFVETKKNKFKCNGESDIPLVLLIFRKKCH